MGAYRRHTSCSDAARGWIKAARAVLARHSLVYYRFDHCHSLSQRNNVGLLAEASERSTGHAGQVGGGIDSMCCSLRMCSTRQACCNDAGRRPYAVDSSICVPQSPRPEHLRALVAQADHRGRDEADKCAAESARMGAGRAPGLQGRRRRPAGDCYQARGPRRRNSAGGMPSAVVCTTDQAIPTFNQLSLAWSHSH